MLRVVKLVFSVVLVSVKLCSLWSLLITLQRHMVVTLCSPVSERGLVKEMIFITK